MTKPVAYSYIRFSTPEQLKGDSLRRQLELSEEYAKNHGLALDTSLTLRDLGLSAFHKTNLEKGALGVFVEAVSKGTIKKGSFLLVENLDRLSRATVLDALNLFLEIIKAGITIVTIGDGMKYSQQSIDDNWTQLLISLSIMVRAHEESATKSKRLSAVWGKKRVDAEQSLVTSMVPGWLKVSDGRIVIDEEKAKTVRDIFTMVRNGYGLNLLERKLNVDQVPPIGKAKRWYRSYLNKLVHNPAIIGVYQPMTGRGKARKPVGEPVKRYFPPLISEEEFYATQRAIELRTAKGGRKGVKIANIFSGLCKCGYCGGPMRYVNKNAATKWQYLVCSNAKSGLGCRHVPWNYHEFENTVLSKLAGLDIAAVLKDEKAEEDKNQLESEKAKLDDIRKRIGKLIELAELSEDIPALAARLRGHKEEEQRASEAVRELESKVLAPTSGRKHFEQFRRLRESLDTATDDELIDLRLRVSLELKRFLNRIEIYPEGHEPWSFEMTLIGIQPGKDGRFVAVIFKTGDGRILHGANGMATIWRGPKSAEAVAKASVFPTKLKRSSPNDK